MLSLDTMDITSEGVLDEKGFPFEEWDVMRREAPVYWYQRPGLESFWSVTKHEHVARIARHPDIFTYRERVAIETPDEVDAWETERERRGRVSGHRADHPPGLGFMDAPRHRWLKQIMNPSLAPRGLAGLEQLITELAETYVADFARSLDENGTADVAHQLSARLPLAAMFQILGVPTEDWDRLFQLHRMTAAAFHKDTERPDGEDPWAAFLNAMMELDGYMSELVRKHMADTGSGGKDLLSEMARGRIQGEPLPRYEIGYHLFNLLQAGNGTARNAIAGGIKALLEHPDQLRKLVDDPSLVNSAVEEILRWTSVAVLMARTCSQDIELGGQLLRKGDTVATWYPAANRDPDVFPDPYRFDITRDPNPHFAFGGYGEHLCIGANLARMELRCMFRALIPLLPSLDLAGPSKMVILRLLVSEFVKLPVRRRETNVLA